MKKSAIVTGFVIILATIFSNTQAQTEIPVKILPSAQAGLIKILFVHENLQSVQVKFYNSNGLYTLDFIDKNTFQSGFLKRYDISKVESEDFWIEISLADLSVTSTYKMTKSKDKKTYEPQLEQTVLNYSVVASLN